MEKSFIVDSYAWIEYFNATKKGEKVKKIIEDEKNELYTLDVCLAEIKFWALSQGIDFERLYQIIRANSTILECWSNDWLSAAEIKFEKRKKHRDFGLVDAIIIVKNQQLEAKIVTGDKHFKEEKTLFL